MTTKLRKPRPVDVHAGRQLRTRRQQRGLPQKDLAKLLGISFQQVQKYESGANRISASTMWELCRVLGVEPGYFFDGLARQRGAAVVALEAVDGRSARQQLDLNRAYEQIDDPRVRRQIVQLVKALVRPAAKVAAVRQPKRRGGRAAALRAVA